MDILARDASMLALAADRALPLGDGQPLTSTESVKATESVDATRRCCRASDVDVGHALDGIGERQRALVPPAAVHTLKRMSFFSEDALRTAVFFLVRIVEAAAALIIFAGAIVGFVRFVARSLRRRHAAALVPVRLDLGRFLALGLEVQLASDLLRTAVAPSFAEIGKLAAVAAIRTALNFFLGREIKEERAEVERQGGGHLS